MRGANANIFTTPIFLFQCLATLASTGRGSLLLQTVSPQSCLMEHTALLGSKNVFLMDRLDSVCDTPTGTKQSL